MKKILLVLSMLSATAFADPSNEALFSADRASGTVNSDSANLESVTTLDITATVTESQPANDTAISGVGEVQTLTFETKSNSDAGDYIVFYDASGAAWAYSTDKAGTDPEPTGDAWDAVAAANKVHCDISAATTAAQVAAAAELCIDALTGLTAVITTDDSAANGTMLFTQVESGPTTDPVPHNEDDSGAGGLAGTQTTLGVLGKVSVSGDTIDFGAPGYVSGLKGTLTTTGNLPTGLSTATPYWLIQVDSNKYQFASSITNANAGTEIDITALGDGTHTFVVDADLEADIKLQKNNEPIGETPIWFDITSSTQAVDAGGTFNWTIANAGYREIRAVYIGESSEATVSVRLNGK